MKDYHLHRKYSAYKGNTVVSFKYAKVRTLESGISHVIKLQDKRKVVLYSVDITSFVLAYHREFVDGQYVGLVDKKRFKIKKVPYKITYKGFNLTMLSISKKKISYIINSEPEALSESPGWFSGSSGLDGSEDTKKSVDNKKEGLAF